MTYTLTNVFVAALCASAATLLIERWRQRRRVDAEVAREVAAAFDAVALMLERGDRPDLLADALRATAHTILAERFGEDHAVTVRHRFVMGEGINDGT